MDLCPLHIIFLFFLPEQAKRAADVARGAKRLVYHTCMSELYEVL